MRTLIILAATTSVLTLGACNRETETAPATDDATMGTGATATEPAGADAGATATNGNAPSRSAGANRDMTSGADGESMDPSGPAIAGATGTAIGPVTDTTRDTAKEAAEATNLHPRPAGR